MAKNKIVAPNGTMTTEETLYWAEEKAQDRACQVAGGIHKAVTTDKGKEIRRRAYEYITHRTNFLPPLTPAKVAIAIAAREEFAVAVAAS